MTKLFDEAILHWTVQRYEKLIAAGILEEDEKLELINGQILKMSPVGNRHAACVELLADLLRENIAPALQVRMQNPVVLDDFSEPEPDLALVNRREDYYRDGHPRLTDIHLLIEVSDTSLEKDRNIKIPFYASCGVKEVWIVNLEDSVVERYWSPEQGEYQKQKEYSSFSELPLPMNGQVNLNRLFDQ